MLVQLAITSDVVLAHQVSGRFTPVEGAEPFIGEIGKSEEVEEERIEVVLPGSIRSKVLKAMLRSPSI